MNNKYAIMTISGYVVRRGITPSEPAYHCVTTVGDAKHFNTAGDATQWLERASFYNGEEGRLFSGSLQIVRVEVQLTYVDAGSVA